MNDLIGEIGNPANEEFSSLAVGINADTLAVWLLDAIHPFLLGEPVLLDSWVDDQEQTHRLFKNGEVMGCISSQEKPMQGCKIEYLGRMNYNMMVTPEFAARWFPNGFTIEDVHRAPAIIFDGNDELQQTPLYLSAVFGETPASIPTNYVPSVEKYPEVIALGLAYGMLPGQQSTALVRAGQMLDLLPDCHAALKLYWHCWSLKSKLLNKFTQPLTQRAKTLLEQ